MWKLAVSWAMASLLLACVFPPLNLEGKTCTSTEPCPRDLVCVVDSRGESVCRAPENVCVSALLSCERTSGVCAGRQRYCGTQGPELVCTGRSYGSDYEPVELRCDGRDNDCDGVVDGSKLVELSTDALNFDWVAVDGGYLAAYEAPFDPGGGRVYLRRFDPSLTPLGPPREVLVGGSGALRYAQNPRLSASDAGLYLAYIEYSATLAPANLMLRRVSESGEVMIARGHESGVVIEGLATAGVFGPLMLAPAPDGLVVAWVRANNYDFRAIRANFQGAPVSSIATFGSVAPGSREYRSADFAVGPSGFWAAWSGGSQLRWQRLDFQLKPQGDAGAVSFPDPISEIVTGVFDDGQPLFATVVNGTTNSVVVVKGMQPQATTVGPALSTLPVLLRARALSGGEFALAWTHLNGVSGAVVRTDGTVGAPVALLQDAGSRITELAIAGDSRPIATAVSGPKMSSQEAPRIVGGFSCAP